MPITIAAPSGTCSIALCQLIELPREPQGPPRPRRAEGALSARRERAGVREPSIVFGSKSPLTLFAERLAGGLLVACLPMRLRRSQVVANSPLPGGERGRGARATRRSGQRLSLHLAKGGADLDQVDAGGGQERRHRAPPRAGRRASGCRAPAPARRGALGMGSPCPARRPRTIGRPVRRTPG